MKTLKPYMAYEKDNCSEVAILVWHYTAKEAKKYYWSNAGEIYFLCDYVDLRCTLIRDKISDKPKRDEPHIVDDPVCCKGCDHWGEELNDDRLCESCAEDYHAKN